MLPQMARRYVRPEQRRDAEEIRGAFGLVAAAQDVAFVVLFIPRPAGIAVDAAGGEIERIDVRAGGFGSCDGGGAGDDFIVGMRHE